MEAADSVDDVFDSMNVSEGVLSAFDITDASLDESLFHDSIDSVESLLNSSSTSSASCCLDVGSSGSAKERETAVSTDNRYLYEGSKLQSYILTMKYALRHGLTKLALSDLLDLVGMLIPDSSMVSLYRYKRKLLVL